MTWPLDLAPSLLVMLGAIVLGCSGARSGAQSEATTSASVQPIEAEVTRVLDDWHDAAAHSDEDRYFGHLTKDAIFIGTDATERWNVEAFRAYAHPRFSAGKGWVMHATSRHVTFATGAQIAWFDEELTAQNLGPARGSGVLVRGDDGTFRIAHYVLSVSVPNERFKAVKELLEQQ